jgi:hyperosmotically inducible protein
MRYKQSLWIPGAVVLAVVATACSSTRSAGRQLDDGAITTKINAKLAADPDINPFNIDVDTLNGVVTLRGEVEKEMARTAAERLARDTDGVLEVRNDIRLQGEPGEDDETVSDGAITAKIKTKLAADPEINSFNVDVDTLDGVVTLSGVIAEAENVERIERIARETEGVVAVENELQVGDDG